MAYSSSEANRQYYRLRDERARDWGFTGYSQERRYKEKYRGDIDQAGNSLAWRQSHYSESKSYKSENPKQMVAFKEGILDPASNPYIDMGMKRHAAVSYFKEWENASTDEAIAAMRLIYGPS